MQVKLSSSRAKQNATFPDIAGLLLYLIICFAKDSWYERQSSNIWKVTLCPSSHCSFIFLATRSFTSHASPLLRMEYHHAQPCAEVQWGGRHKHQTWDATEEKHIVSYLVWHCCILLPDLRRSACRIFCLVCPNNMASFAYEGPWLWRVGGIICRSVSGGTSWLGREC